MLPGSKQSLKLLYHDKQLSKSFVTLEAEIAIHYEKVFLKSIFIDTIVVISVPDPFNP